MKHYAGIGSRSTPKETLKLMYHCARYLDEQGYTLRSGGAIGADTYFERGAGLSEIFTPKRSIPDKFFEIASEYHPAWHMCKPYAKRLHARNAMIVLGDDPECFKPVEFILCWTKGAMISGGTGQALRMAPEFNIPVINFALYDKDNIVNRIKNLIKERIE